jgi:uncharacterized protein (DUF2267 family)
MIMDFDKFATNGNRFLKELSTSLNAPWDREHAAYALKATLNTLREQLTVEESLQLIAQLPMFLKAVYVDGWSIKKHDLPRHHGGFLDRVMEHLAMLGPVPHNGHSMEVMVRAVFFNLRNHISDGEWEDVLAQLPRDVKKLLTEPLQVH